MSIKNKLIHIIKCSLQELNIDKDTFNVEIPKDKTKGDYSTNVALTLASTLHKKPEDIAKDIKEQLKQVDEQQDNIIDHIEVAYPGFINIFISKRYLLDNINTINIKKKEYGRSNYGGNRKINLEFVSANPTGTLHVGHGRGATYGDNLARILNFIGFDVTKEYYVNDAGNQINNLGISIKERYKEICGLTCQLPEDGYHGKEIITIAKNIYNEHKDSKLDSDIEYFKQEGVNILLSQIKKDLDRYRVNFDVFTSEQSLYDRGLVDDTLEKLKRSNQCFIDDNALWLKTTNYGDEKDRVLIKQDGNYTYFLPDIAYHIDKINRGYDGLIDVLGSDHHGYIHRLKAALAITGNNPDILDIKILQMVRLIKDGEEIKLSKRTGKTITFKELMDEVGINATRYFFASKSLDTQMDFDIGLAQRESSDNPVYYIEYANARISSILNNYGKTIPTNLEFKHLENEITYTILNKLYEFEDIVISAGQKQIPHLIANYVYELATLFHSYYTKEKIITDDTEATIERIAFLNAIKIVINNALDLIGIIPREQM